MPNVHHRIGRANAVPSVLRAEIAVPAAIPKPQLPYAQMPHKAADLSPRAESVLHALHRGPGGFRPNRLVIDLTDAEIARRARCSIATVRRALAELKAAGLIVWVTNGNRRTIERLYEPARGKGQKARPEMIKDDQLDDHQRSSPAAPPQTPPIRKKKDTTSSSLDEKSDDDDQSSTPNQDRQAAEVMLATAVETVRQAHGDDQAEAIRAAVPGIERKLQVNLPRLELAYVRACIVAGIYKTAAKKANEPVAYFAAIAPDIATTWPPHRVRDAIDRPRARRDPELAGVLGDVRAINSLSPQWPPGVLRRHLEDVLQWPPARIDRALAYRDNPGLSGERRTP